MRLGQAASELSHTSRCDRARGRGCALLSLEWMCRGITCLAVEAARDPRSQDPITPSDLADYFDDISGEYHRCAVRSSIVAILVIRSIDIIGRECVSAPLCLRT